MSGYLQRLVGRAMGLSNSVRSAARLPYATPPALMVKDGATAAPHSRFVDDLLASPAEPAPLRSPTRGGEPSRNLPEALREAPDQRDIAEDRSQEDDHAAEPRDHAIEPEQFEFGESAQVIRDETRKPAPKALPEPRLRRSGKSGETAKLVVPSDRGTFHVADDMVELLLPPLRRESPQTPMASEAATRNSDISRNFAADGRREDITEVHVSIGRIEVTAVHEAPAPKPRSSPAVKPMTLDDYLARRRGGRSE